MRLEDSTTGIVISSISIFSLVNKLLNLIHFVFYFLAVLEFELRALRLLLEPCPQPQNLFSKK
jgi:hypothetical protein